MNDRVDRQFRARTPAAGTTRRPPLPSKLPPRAALPAPAVVPEPSPDPFQVEPAHHRWLLTTCVAGIAGSLVIGSAVMLLQACRWLWQRGEVGRVTSSALATTLAVDALFLLAALLAPGLSGLI